MKKGSRSVEDYLREFKSICDNLAAIKKPVSDMDKVFQFAHGLGGDYMHFRTTMLTKPPYPSFNQFVMALQGHEQTVLTQRNEEKHFLDQAQVFFTQRGRGRGRRGGGNGRGNFNSRGRGFIPAGRFKSSNNNYSHGVHAAESSSNGPGAL